MKENSYESTHNVASVLKKVLEKQNQLQDDDKIKAKEIKDLHQEIKDMRQEIDFYAPFSLTRHLAVVSLMASLLKLLNHLFMRKADATVKAMKLVFPKAEHVSYFKSWWFLYNETMEEEGVSLVEFWRKTLGYTGKKLSADSKKKRKKGTPAARLTVERLQRVMIEVEQECIYLVGPGISADMLRKCVGFYISLLRTDKNSGIHLFENMLVVSKIKDEQPVQYKRPATKDPFKFVDRDLTITENEELRNDGVLVLKEILSNIDKMKDLACIAPIVKWFGEWLVFESGWDEEEDDEEIMEKDPNVVAPLWEWCEEVQRNLYKDLDSELFYDEEGCAWAYIEDRWLTWIDKEDGWCAEEGGRWKKHF